MSTEFLDSVPANVRAFIARGVACGLLVGRMSEPANYWHATEPEERITLTGTREQFAATGDCARVRWPQRCGKWGKFWSAAGVLGRIERTSAAEYRLVLRAWQSPSRSGLREAVERARSDEGFAAFMRAALAPQCADVRTEPRRGDKRGGSTGKARRA